METLRALSALAKALPSTECIAVVDGMRELPKDLGVRVAYTKSRGYVESVLDEALSHCWGDYILRLDDDELPSLAMQEWLRRGEFRAHDHWKFARIHLWPDRRSALLTPHLFPDHQTRLSVRAKSGGRYSIHAPSPFGSGVEAPVAILHLKFLVRTREQREQTAAKWHNGAMTAFSLPEDVYDEVTVADAGAGYIPLRPTWKYEVRMSEVLQ